MIEGNKKKDHSLLQLGMCGEDKIRLTVQENYHLAEEKKQKTVRQLFQRFEF